MSHYCNTNNKTSPARINREYIKQRALELRRSRTPDGRTWTYDMIGEELGIQPFTVWKCVAEGLAEIKYDTRERAHELRAVNTHRIELALDKMLTKIAGGHAKASDYNTFIKLIEVENKMWGINEPETFELTVKVEDMTTEEKIKRIGELMKEAYQARLLGSESFDQDRTVAYDHIYNDMQWHVVDESAEPADVEKTLDDVYASRPRTD